MKVRRDKCLMLNVSISCVENECTNPRDRQDIMLPEGTCWSRDGLLTNQKHGLVEV